MRRLERVLVGLLALGALLPHLQQHLRLFPVRPLQGRTAQFAPAAVFSVQGWLAGSYQEAARLDLGQRFGFRQDLLRLEAQIAYSLYGRAKANGVVIGTAGQLYPQGHVDAWAGRDFAGEAALERRLGQLRRVQSALERRGVTLLLVLVPGKAAAVPEHLPASAGTPGSRTNQRYLASHARARDVNVLDLAPLVAQWRTREAFPIYPVGGMHLSRYGAHLAGQALAAELERLRGQRLPELLIESVEAADTSASDDGDLLRGMNLLWTPRLPPHGVPHARYRREGRTLLRVLTVGDSYHWLFETEGIAAGLYGSSQFWFYYDQLHVAGQPALPRERVDLAATLARQDVVILVACDASLPRLGWGFLEDLDDLTTRGRVEPRPRLAPQPD